MTDEGDFGVGISPALGFVPDASTAIRISEAVLRPVYGLEAVERQRPFTAVLEGDVWRVEGTNPTQAIGGTALVRVSRVDGRILHMHHTR
jgi:hypothetical protein